MKKVNKNLRLQMIFQYKLVLEKIFKIVKHFKNFVINLKLTNNNTNNNTIIIIFKIKINSNNIIIDNIINLIDVFLLSVIYYKN